jgi:phosphoadenosine phosphosulfate reductase
MSLALPVSEVKLKLHDINQHLSTLSPDQILEWAVHNLPNLYQTTAFGLTGLVVIDMFARSSLTPPPLIFLDTLYHFNETLDLVERVKRRYGIAVRVYRPQGVNTVPEFEERYGTRLWETDEDRYDYLVKVSPFF